MQSECDPNAINKENKENKEINKKIALPFKFSDISDELKTEVDSLKIETRILKEKIKKDTIIINLNLKQK